MVSLNVVLLLHRGAPSFAAGDGAYVPGNEKRTLSTLPPGAVVARLASYDSSDSATMRYDSYWRVQDAADRKLANALATSRHVEGSGVDANAEGGPGEGKDDEKKPVEAQGDPGEGKHDEKKLVEAVRVGDPGEQKVEFPELGKGGDDGNAQEGGPGRTDLLQERGEEKEPSEEHDLGGYSPSNAHESVQSSVTSKFDKFYYRLFCFSNQKQTMCSIYVMFGAHSCWFRLRRYCCGDGKKKKPAASKETLAMFNDPKKRSLSS